MEFSGSAPSCRPGSLIKNYTSPSPAPEADAMCPGRQTDDDWAISSRESKLCRRPQHAAHMNFLCSDGGLDKHMAQAGPASGRSVRSLICHPSIYGYGYWTPTT